MYRLQVELQLVLSNFSLPYFFLFLLLHDSTIALLSFSSVMSSSFPTPLSYSSFFCSSVTYISHLHCWLNQPTCTASSAAASAWSTFSLTVQFWANLIHHSSLHLLLRTKSDEQKHLPLHCNFSSTLVRIISCLLILIAKLSCISSILYNTSASS